MTASAWRILRAKRADLLADLEARAPGLSPEDLQTTAAELRTLDEMLDRLEPRQPAWHAPTIVGLLALSVVILGSAIRTPRTSIGVQANVDSVELVGGVGAGQTPVNANSIQVSDFQVGGAPQPPYSAVVITSLRIEPSTRLRLQTDGAKCLLALAPPGGSGAINLQVLDQEASVQTLRLGPGMSFRACLTDPDVRLLFQDPASVQISRMDDAGPPELRSSSIRSGTLLVGETGRKQQLGDLDQIALSGIRNGVLIVRPGEQLALSFSGSAARAQMPGERSGLSRSLAPTLLELVTSSPDLRSIFGLITGLVGLIWGAIRYFGLRLRFWPGQPA